jgi:hypothetical protein
MATVAEAIGLALPYSCGAPAPYEIRDRFCYAAGEKVMELIAKQIGRAISSRPARRWKMQRPSLPLPAVRPMPRCTAGDRP